ncbi:MAG: hypothetical protein M0R50_11285 [Candidatus Cloacimonetes bacterium]|jgi:hypothetical protein|nr:hypothetical protein [Candidatus Cloacimonadota bacterium]
MAKAEKNNIQKPQESATEQPQQKDARVEFEQRFNFFMTGFRTVCEEAKVPVAFAIVVDPENPSTPFIYDHGHIYDQASLLATVLRNMKSEINKEISV